MNWTFSPGDEMAETIAVGLPSWALLPPQNRHLKRWNLPEKLSGWTGGFHEKLIGLWFGRSWFGRICRKFCRGSMSFCFAHKHSMILWWFHAVFHPWFGQILLKYLVYVPGWGSAWQLHDQSLRSLFIQNFKWFPGWLSIMASPKQKVRK